MKSIEKRVREAMDDLTLILAGLSAPDGEPRMPYTQNELDRAMFAAAARAYAELYWLTTLPADVLNVDAPTDDEREEQEEAGGVR